MKSSVDDAFTDVAVSPWTAAYVVQRAVALSQLCDADVCGEVAVRAGANRADGVPITRMTTPALQPTRVQSPAAALLGPLQPPSLAGFAGLPLLQSSGLPLCRGQRHRRASSGAFSAFLPDFVPDTVTHSLLCGRL